MDSRRSEWRRLRATLVIAGVVLAFVAIWAVWAERQGLRTNQWTETSDELIEREEVRSALATYAVGELYDNVNVRRELRKVLPEELNATAGPAAAGLRGAAESLAEEVMSTEQFQAVWRQANAAAHRSLLNMLYEEQGQVVTARDERAILDLRPLVIEIAREVGLGQGVAREIPQDAAEIEIVRADELETAQTTARAIDGIAIASSLLALAFFALALYLARGERWITAAQIGGGLVLAGLVALLVREVAGDLIVERLAEPRFEPAGAAVWEVGTSMHTDVAQVAILYGAGFLLAAWLGSPTSSAGSARRVIAPVLRERLPLVLLVLAIPAAIWILEGAASERAVITRSGLAVLAAAGILLLRRRTMREFPRATLDDVGGGIRDAAAQVGETVQSGARKARSALAEVTNGRRASDGGRGDGAGGDQLDRLERLGALKEKGLLTKKEFDAQKAELLGNGTGSGRRRGSGSSRSASKRSGNRSKGKGSSRSGSSSKRSGGARASSKKRSSRSRSASASRKR